MRSGWITLGIFCLVLAGCPDGTGTGTEEVDPEFVVNEYQEEDQMNPVVVAMPSGLFLMVWQSGCQENCAGQDGSQYGVYARRFEPNGLPLGSEFRVNDEVHLSQSYPHAAMLPDGRFAIVWAHESSDASDAWDVRLKLYGSEGVELAGEIGVNTETQGAQWWPQVGLSSDGAAHVVWQDDSAAGYGIMGRRIDAYGDPLGADAIVPGADGGQRPALASLPDGRSVLVWSGFGIQGVRLAEGEVVGDTFEVSEGFTAQYPMPAVAVAPSGEFVVAWSGGDGWEDEYDIRARAFGADANPLMSEIEVNDATDGMQLAAAVTLSQGGDQFLVSWESALEDGANKEIIAKTYLLDGTPQEPDFVVNSYQAQMQDAPTATSTYEGFLVAWQSSPESGDGYNVYVKLFPLWP